MATMTQHRIVTREYDIATGSKQDFYTLWLTKHVDLRPRDAQGNILETFKANAVGGNMYYHVHIIFIQNLGKTKESALEKAIELGVPIKTEQFDFELKHLTKPSFEAFGVKMKYDRGKWFAKATTEFFDCWRANKEVMKANGWSCWKYEKENTWYMGVRTEENKTS